MAPKTAYTLTWMAAFALIMTGAAGVSTYFENGWLILVAFPVCYAALTIINLLFQRWLGRWPP